ncbi:MAG: GNAT family N-acetyltransferase [Armatimonadetes bacterium]|nr:GNAT family N-acetyltransferase [Armatimonadota bacterium]
MDFVVREIRRDDVRDAERLADMWNASDAGWPGGWSGGVPSTPERMADRLRKSDALAIYVVEADDQILGYGDLIPQRGRDDAAYLGLLNVRPDHHGQGLGKALILAILDRTTALGKQQLELGTWAGNLKAVPLYKKTGFFWEPDTSVHMRNFIPAALQYPLARRFFERHLWYDCFQRDLAVAPDDVEWEGTKVYPYCFAADGETFTLWIDRHAAAPCAVETDELFASCLVGAEEIVCGLPHTVRWRLINKRGGAPLQVTLLAESDEGIGLRTVRSFEVAGEEVIEESFTITPDLPKRPWGLPAPQIRSTLVVDGIALPLGTATPPVQPLDVWLSGLGPVPGKRQEVKVNLRNRLDREVTGEVRLAPHPDLRFDTLTLPFTAAARSWTCAKTHMVTDPLGASEITAQAICPAEINPGLLPGGGELRTKRFPVTFRAMPLDRVYAWESAEDEAVVVEAPHLYVWMGLRGGNASITERASGRQVAQLRASKLGPPFSRWATVPPLYAHHLEQHDGTVRLTLAIPHDQDPEIVLEQSLTVGAGPLLKLEHRVLNTGDAAFTGRVALGGWSQLDGAITLPLADGLLHEVQRGWGGYPAGDDVPKQPEAYAETWVAMEEDGLVTGLVFTECAERGHLGLELDVPEVAPRATLDLPPVWLVAGRGDWELVRQQWIWLCRPSDVKEEHRPDVRPVLDVRLDPVPVILTGPEAEATLQVRHRRAKRLTGTWRVEGGLTVTPAEGELSDVWRESPLDLPLSVSNTDPTPRAERLTVRIEDDAQTYTIALPAFVLGDATAEVATRDLDDGRLEVDNGRLCFQVAQAFHGAVTSLWWHGAEQLLSPWPEPCAHAWLNPWYGGVHAYVYWPGNDWFARQTFAGEPVERVGARGIRWTGVQTWCDVAHKDHAWLRVEAEYLTTAGSNLVALVHRLVNRSTGVRGASGGLAVWPQAGGTVADNVVWAPVDRPRYGRSRPSTECEPALQSHRRSDYSVEWTNRRWAAAESPEHGALLAVVPAHPRYQAAADDMGRDGALLTSSGWLELEPGESKESLTWLVLADGIAAMDGYAGLSEVWELP